MIKVTFFSLIGLTISGIGIFYIVKYIRKKPYLKPKSIYLINNLFQWNTCNEIIQKELLKLPVLGFDCEWKNIKGKAKPVSLIQLATNSGLCFLIRINLFQDNIPASLTQLLSNRRILKVGVGVVEDANKLLRDHDIHCLGCLDLRNFMLRNQIPILRGGGLKTLAKDILNVDLDKSYFLRCSDWESVVLTQAQMHYAACDALVAVRILMSILNSKQNNSFDVSTDNFLSLFQGILDIKFRNNIFDENDLSNKKTQKFLDQIDHKNNDSNNLKSSRSYSVRKLPLYQNCKLFAQDGQMLCTCDSKKANWYLDKGLGEMMSENPLSVRLLFETAGRPLDDSNYYAQEKNNVCVVCGRDDSYIRKNIVPHEYRKHFPTIMKEHKSHDIVLLCTNCHMKSNERDNWIKQRISHECQVPLNLPMYANDPYLAKVKSAAKALLNRSYRIPETRREELQQIVSQFYGVGHLTTDILTQAAQLEIKKPITGYSEHGEVVVSFWMGGKGLVAFERMWREHFLSSMKPQHMPAMWTVDHGHEEIKLMNS